MAAAPMGAPCSMAHSTASRHGVHCLPGSLRRCSSTGTPRWCQRHTSRKPPDETGSDRRRRRTSSALAAAAQQQQLVTEDFKDYILDLQRRIISAAEAMDGSGARFVHDRWERDAADPNAGYGITSVLEGGAVLEKAAANISVVAGKLSPERAQAMSSRGRSSIDPAGGQSYSAAALSLVFHSAHPLIPTLRADVRLFEVEGQQWYGGGCDLTPFYINDEDCREFHGYWRRLCDRHDTQLYPQYKAWCDRYFYLPARGENRGVGGLFFDDVEAQQAQQGAQQGAAYDVQQFVRDVGDGILPSWAGIVARRRGAAVDEAQRAWQLLRRGRYLEFNLLYDRGVKFGLDGGRVESIMVSAPPLITWRYNVQPAPGSDEERLVAVLRSPQEWA